MLMCCSPGNFTFRESPPKSPYSLELIRRRIVLLAACYTALACLLNIFAGQRAHGQEYRYSPFEKPDPFDPAFATRIQDVTNDPLLKHNLSDMSLSAIFIGRQSGAYALVEVPDGGENTTRTYSLKVGDKLGPRSGQIIAILRDRLVIREPLEAPRDGAYSRFQDTAMILRAAPDSVEEKVEEPQLRDVSLDGETAPKPLEDALTADVLPSGQNTYSPYRPSVPKKIEKYRATTGTGIKMEKLNQGGELVPDAGGSGLQRPLGTGIQVSPLQPPGSPLSLSEGAFSYENKNDEVDYGYSSF